MTKRVSSYLIAKTLGPFCSPIDEEYEKLMRLDINNEKQLIGLLQEYCPPIIRVRVKFNALSLLGSLIFYTDPIIP